MKYFVMAVIYLLAGYGGYRLLYLMASRYLMKLECFGNVAVRKFYERQHYIKTNNANVPMSVAVTGAILVWILWPVVVLVSAIWDTVNYLITKKEFNKG